MGLSPFAAAKVGLGICSRRRILVAVAAIPVPAPNRLELGHGLSLVFSLISVVSGGGTVPVRVSRASARDMSGLLIRDQAAGISVRSPDFCVVDALTDVLACDRCRVGVQTIAAV
jgi:hypothetical protein